MASDWVSDTHNQPCADKMLSVNAAARIVGIGRAIVTYFHKSTLGTTVLR